MCFVEWGTAGARGVEIWRNGAGLWTNTPLLKRVGGALPFCFSMPRVFSSWGGLGFVMGLFSGRGAPAPAGRRRPTPRPPGGAPRTGSPAGKKTDTPPIDEDAFFVWGGTRRLASRRKSTRGVGSGPRGVPWSPCVRHSLLAPGPRLKDPGRPRLACEMFFKM